MANSKAYLPFVLLIALLLTSHVLAHDSPQNQHWYDEEGNFKYVNPTSSQDLEKNYWRDGSSKPSFRHFVGRGYQIQTPRLAHVEPTTPPIHSTKVDELGEPDWHFPQAPRKSMLGTRSRHHTHSTTYDPSNLEVNEKSNQARKGPKGPPSPTFPGPPGGNIPRTRSRYNTISTNYNPSNLEVNEPKNYTDASVTRHGNMERHASPEYCRAFREFQARTYGKVDFGVPVPGDIGEETKN